MASGVKQQQSQAPGSMVHCKRGLEVQAQVKTMWRIENLILPAADRTLLPRSSIPQATEYNGSCEVSGNFTGRTNTFTVSELLSVSTSAMLINPEPVLITSDRAS